MTSGSVADETDDWCVGLACVLKLVFITSLRPITTTLWASCAVPATRSAWCPGVWTSSTTCCSRSVGPSTARRTCGSEWSLGFTAPIASRSLRRPRQALSDSKLNAEWRRNFLPFYLLLSVFVHLAFFLWSCWRLGQPFTQCSTFKDVYVLRAWFPSCCPTKNTKCTKKLEKFLNESASVISAVCLCQF